jgi:ArsR family transcriptional regulator, zinc-responsive transcriptional repressor
MPRKRRNNHEQLDPEMLERAAVTLRVMAHPVRLKIAELLLEEAYSVGELAEAVDLAPAAVSQHLSIMRAQGVVRSQRSGRSVYYEVIAPQATYIIDCLKDHCDEI